MGKLNNFAKESKIISSTTKYIPVIGPVISDIAKVFGYGKGNITKVGFTADGRLMTNMGQHHVPKQKDLITKIDKKVKNSILKGGSRRRRPRNIHWNTRRLLRRRKGGIKYGGGKVSFVTRGGKKVTFNSSGRKKRKGSGFIDFAKGAFNIGKKAYSWFKKGKKAYDAGKDIYNRNKQTFDNVVKKGREVNDFLKENKVIGNIGSDIGNTVSKMGLTKTGQFITNAAEEAKKHGYGKRGGMRMMQNGGLRLRQNGGMRLKHNGGNKNKKLSHGEITVGLTKPCGFNTGLENPTYKLNKWLERKYKE